MCGIFGIIGAKTTVSREIKALGSFAEQRGRDSSGLIVHSDSSYRVYRADTGVQRLISQVRPHRSECVIGHSRLITNGLADNQPIIRDGVAALHNGIVVNDDLVWSQLTKRRTMTTDTEVIAAIAAEQIDVGLSLDTIQARINELCQGVVACAILIPRLGKLMLYSNNGSLYVGQKYDASCFSSERFPLSEIGCTGIQQVKQSIFLDVPISVTNFTVDETNTRSVNLIPPLPKASHEAALLRHVEHDLRRCKRCILPETMPFIEFDETGVCNYCRSYRLRNQPKPFHELLALVQPYRRNKGAECIVPLSGGRDSCFSLHLVIEHLGMQPVTYTYDWGMVTDLARRNISRMCSRLGIENIIIAADIEKKRRYIAMNLKAWLKSPNLGMISILTAGDKHFFRHLRTVQRQTEITLNLWGVNPLEVTHFKAGFLGIPPDFAETRVYSSGLAKQVRYQFRRSRAMSQSPGYFNRSLWDTLSGEYYRSFAPKKDYFHVFDYWKWDEAEIDATLHQYDWELAPDTTSTWRIGDGTAAFYNYLYYSVAGLTEHDTFRSNQIREGDLSRGEALELVKAENRPRYQNIKWYLDALGLDFEEVISTVNRIPSLY